MTEAEFQVLRTMADIRVAQAGLWVSNERLMIENPEALSTQTTWPSGRRIRWMKSAPRCWGRLPASPIGGPRVRESQLGRGRAYPAVGSILFLNKGEHDVERYASYGDAVRGHQALVAKHARHAGESPRCVF